MVVLASIFLRHRLPVWGDPLRFDRYLTAQYTTALGPRMYSSISGDAQRTIQNPSYVKISTMNLGSGGYIHLPDEPRRI